jgi:hypothetical protein
MATTTLTKAQALGKAKTAARLLGDAEDRHAVAIRAAAEAGASRTEIADAVGLSRTRVQQIIHGKNR